MVVAVLAGLFAKALVTISRARKPKHLDSNTAAVMTPTPFGEPELANLGDDAMTLGLIRHLLDQKTTTKVLVFGHRPYGAFPFEGQVEFLTPGSLQSWRRLPAMIRRPPHHFVGIGADIIDGLYGSHIPRMIAEFCTAGANFGAGAVITNFSWRKTSDPAVVSILKSLPSSVLLVARDPLSQQRAQSDTHRTIGLNADLAFQMRPVTSPLTDQLDEWCDRQRRKGKTIVGLSLNAWPVLESIDTFTTRVLELLVAGLPRESAVVPVVHDYRGTPTDRDLTARVVELLSKNGYDCAPLLALSAAEVKQICASLDLLVSGRMHAAIAALGAGTPVMVLGYADKAEGLLSYFGLEQRVIGVDRIMDGSADLATELSAVTERLENDCASIARALPMVQQRSRAALSGRSA